MLGPGVQGCPAIRVEAIAFLFNWLFGCEVPVVARQKVMPGKCFSRFLEKANR